MVAQGLRRWVRISGKLALLAPAFAIGLPAQWLALKLNARSAARVMPVIFHRYVLWAMGVEVERQGAQDRNRPLLIVANHLSWLDILVVSSLGPVSFIAKSEVAEWPLFGTLARLQRSVFVERARRSKTGESRAQIAERLQTGDAMVLFAEGTTSDGKRVLPFRSALIGAAQAATAGEGEAAFVQSLNIAYPKIGGVPVMQADLPLIAWFGDMELLPHLTDLLTLPGITARVTFGGPREVKPGSDRKALTRDLENEVRLAHAASMTGRARAIP